MNYYAISISISKPHFINVYVVVVIVWIEAETSIGGKQYRHLIGGPF